MNQSTKEPWHTIFTILYAFSALTGFTTNLLLLLSLYCYNASHRGGRNSIISIHSTIDTHRRPLTPSEKTGDLLIAFLATFDLLLSLTMPFTAVDILSKYWPLGHNTELLCRLNRSAPSVVVYCTSMVIILIAINRYRQIVSPTGRQMSPRNIRFIAMIIVIVATTISSPVFMFSKLYTITGEPSTAASHPLARSRLQRH